MKRTKEKMSEMTKEKQNSKKTVDRLVMDELLEMGFSYNHIGTHYLHDSIVYAVSLKVEDFDGINDFCREISRKVSRKYNVNSNNHYCVEITAAINRAFAVGNINYLLETFKGSYDADKMKVTKNAFIMTVRRKIVEALEVQDTHNATQLRLIIQGSVEGITDYKLLKGICDIVLSFNDALPLKESVR